MSCQVIKFTALACGYHINFLLRRMVLKKKLSNTKPDVEILVKPRKGSCSKHVLSSVLESRRFKQEMLFARVSPLMVRDDLLRK